MSDEQEEIRTDRRRFLRNTALGGLAAGAAVGVGGALAGDEPSPAGAAEGELAPGKRGYRRTAHVRRYLDTVRG